jgi:hypothetical protein
MNLEQRIAGFVKLGQRITSISKADFDILQDQVAQKNPWFTPDNTKLALDGISKFLDTNTLTTWTANKDYLLNPTHPRHVGVAMAGNIPLAGFHDFLCVLIAGHNLHAKLSSQDSVLISFLADVLREEEPEFTSCISFQERLNGVDAVIATGGDNTSRYFEYYFRNIPHIIRKNRSSCAVIMGEEDQHQLTSLGQDVFSYFGLGCRNVSKLFVPEQYSFIPLLDSWDRYKEVSNHHKYANNYDYQKSILLVNQVPFLDNGFVMLTEHANLVSPISTLFFEYYKDLPDLHARMQLHQDKIQCIASANAWFNGSVSFGQAQYPEVNDYADKVDTLQFLSVLT